MTLFWGLVLSVGGVCVAAHATAQLELSHVPYDSCGIEGLPPLALGEVLPHLPAHRLVDILTESSVSSDPGMSERLLTRVALVWVLLHQPADEIFG